MKLAKSLRTKLGKTSAPPAEPTLPLARTNAEAHIYMDMHPCVCGESSFARDSAVIEAAGDLASRYEGSCPGCGALRQFVFRVPEEVILPRPGAVVFGAGGSSELLDAGEWLFVAGRYARIAPAKVVPGTEAARVARQQLATAAAAMDEVLAFIPKGANAVPYKSLRSKRGRAVYKEQPGRFRRERLEVVRDTYRRILTEMDATTG